MYQRLWQVEREVNGHVQLLGVTKLMPGDKVVAVPQSPDFISVAEMTELGVPLAHAQALFSWLREQSSAMGKDFDHTKLRHLLARAAEDQIKIEAMK